MSVIRRNNWLGQERVDVPDMRSLDSGIAHDFDVGFGKIMSGREPLVVTGLTIDTTNAFGNPPTSLVLTTAGALVMHYGATEAGTLLEIPDDQATDQLIGSNARVIGSFAANASNYIGIDYLRQADSTTNDQTKFLSANTKQEIVQSVPKGVVLDYRIIISTTPFSLSSNICPVAIVVTNGSGNVSSITDARNLMWRLASGGDVPAPYSSFDWSSRLENANTYAPSTTSDNPFEGGDKDLASQKDWMDAIMSVLWEAKSGEHWYSATSRDMIKLAYSPDVLGNGTNFEWTLVSDTLEWSGLRVIFENSSGSYYNTVQDGDEVIEDGQCLYVDIDRTTSPAATIVPQVGDLQELPAPTIPGSRIIIAWRLGDDIYFKDFPFEVGRELSPVATTTSDGIVRLNQTPGTALHPVVLTVGVDGALVHAATAGNTTGLTITGAGTKHGVEGIGGTGGVTPGEGLRGTGGADTGAGAGDGVHGLGGAAGGIGGGRGVIGQGTGLFEGVVGVGAGTAAGVRGAGGNTAGPGVSGTGGTGGTGVVGIGGATGGAGVSGTGSAGNADGVQGQGQGSGKGVNGTGGATSGAIGVQGTGGSTNGVGVRGDGVGTGAGGVFDGQGNGSAATDDAIIANQNIKFASTNMPASTTGFSNRITPMNICKAHGSGTGNGASAATQNGGFNCVISRVSDSVLRVDFVTPMADGNYSLCITSINGGSIIACAGIKTSAGFPVSFYDVATHSFVNTSSWTFDFTVYGAQ